MIQSIKLHQHYNETALLSVGNSFEFRGYLHHLKAINLNKEGRFILESTKWVAGVSQSCDPIVLTSDKVQKSIYPFPK